MNAWMRSFHRRTSAVFTVGVTVNTVQVVRGAYTNAVGLLAWIPLLLLLVTGLYLFLLPYAARWRQARAGQFIGRPWTAPALSVWVPSRAAGDRAKPDTAKPAR
jgi:hypothetical protein